MQAEEKRAFDLMMEGVDSSDSEDSEDDAKIAEEMMLRQSQSEDKQSYSRPDHSAMDDDARDRDLPRDRSDSQLDQLDYSRSERRDRSDSWMEQHLNATERDGMNSSYGKMVGSASSSPDAKAERSHQSDSKNSSTRESQMQKDSNMEDAKGGTNTNDADNIVPAKPKKPSSLRKPKQSTYDPDRKSSSSSSRVQELDSNDDDDVDIEADIEPARLGPRVKKDSNNNSNSNRKVSTPNRGLRKPVRNSFTRNDSDDDELESERFVLRKSRDDLPSMVSMASSMSLNSNHNPHDFEKEKTGPGLSDKANLNEIENFGADVTWADGDFGVGSFQGSSGLSSNRSDLSDNSGYEAARRWLTRPCEKGAQPLQCFIEREREGFGALHPTFRCWTEPSEYTKSSSKFMMAAKKIMGKASSYYLISLDTTPDDRGSDSVLGRVRGNVIGSDYIITDGGVSASKTMLKSIVRKELGLIKFEFDSKSPSTVELYIPSVSNGGAAFEFQPIYENRDGISNAVKDRDMAKVFHLKNKVPKWDSVHGGHVLNFGGRVTESSVKNFQLTVSENADGIIDDDITVLQFGKVDKNKFSMDVSWPLSPLQAFGLCVASMDGKIADRKGYELFKGLWGK